MPRITDNRALAADAARLKACAAFAARVDALYADAEAQQQKSNFERRASTFDIDTAIWIGRDGQGFHVDLQADPCGDGYLLFLVCDNDANMHTVYGGPELLPRLTATRLCDYLQDTCDEFSITVSEWGLRRPGTSRLARPIARMVHEAEMDRVDFDAAPLATQPTLGIPQTGGH
jgi:hypothetical protein